MQERLAQPAPGRREARSRSTRSIRSAWRSCASVRKPPGCTAASASPARPSASRRWRRRMDVSRGAGAAAPARDLQAQADRGAAARRSGRGGCRLWPRDGVSATGSISTIWSRLAVQRADRRSGARRRYGARASRFISVDEFQDVDEQQLPAARPARAAGRQPLRDRRSATRRSTAFAAPTRPASSASSETIARPLSTSTATIARAARSWPRPRK